MCTIHFLSDGLNNVQLVLYFVGIHDIVLPTVHVQMYIVHKHVCNVIHSHVICHEIR